MKIHKVGGLLVGAFALSASAADYNVPDDGTLDEVIGKAAKGDTVYVAPGTYQTSAQYGPNILCNLIGTGATRDDVVIESSGSYRTLRLADGGRIENVTIVGEGSYKADKGGAVEVNGGMITNCVIRDGTAYGNDSKNAGGNLYVNANGALIVDCVISGGRAKNRGGNVCLDFGTVRNCTITDGSITEKRNDVAEPFGGNVFTYRGTIEGCTISGGTNLVSNGGNVYLYDPVSAMRNCTLSEGSGVEGGCVFMRNGGTVSGCTIFANGTTKGSGGGIYMNNSNCTVEDTTIDGADGTMSWHGGCIYMKGGTVRRTTCQNGVCPVGGRQGGNVYMEGGTLEDVTLLDGTAADRGGNLYMTGGAALRLDCRRGRAGSDGGNVLATGSATITDSTLADGVIVTDAEKKGVNIYMDGNVKLVRSTLTGGTSWKADGVTAGFNGGSVCMWSSTALIDTCLVSGCNRGGILSGTTGHVYGTTIVNNDYGYWAWNASQTLQNCVIYGNAREYSGNQPSGSNGSCVNCAVSENSLSPTTYPTLVIVTDDDFADFAGGDYRPTETSRLTDAGAADARTDASVTDLDGKPRLSEGIDIGCYEYQHANMTVSFTVPALDHAYTPATVTFTATAVNAPGDVTFVVDFGDGTVRDFATGAISYVYTTSGDFTISVVAKSGAVTSKPMTRDVKIVDKVLRVGAGGFDTIAAAVAAAADGCDIVIASGIYEITDPILVDKAVTMTAEGAVTVRNVATASSSSADHHVMTVGSGAFVSGIVFENGQVYNRYGGNLVIDGGTVSNCVIRSGLVTVSNGDGGGAGAVLNVNSRMTHCTVTGNAVHGTANTKDKAGGAIFVPNGGKSVKILNSLIADNTYRTSGDTARSGAAGVMYGGSNENALMENCTVAGNVVEGSLANPSAGAYCTSWSAVFRNNVFAANRETGRDGASAVHLGDGHNTVTFCMTDAETKWNDSCFIATPAEMFKSVAAKNYKPKTLGALCNKGTNPTTGETTDLLGFPRVAFGVVDLGCYESQSKAGMIVVVR